MHFRSGGGFQHFDMQNADDIFKEFFGGRDPFANFFDDDQDDFFNNGFGGMGGMSMGHHGFGQMGMPKQGGQKQ